MLRTLTSALRRVKQLLYLPDRLATLDRLERRNQLIQEALGRIELRQLQQAGQPALADREFRVFSQWGEDGIIQFLLTQLRIERRIFVEFGADDYNFESNTRFLLANDNWTGLVIDSSEAAIERVRRSSPYVLHDLRVARAVVTRDNINALLSSHGITGEIGLLSIDVDGNDYWIWRAIDVISPVIVVVEYNYRFGRERAVTIPYDEHFDRAKAHPSRLYFGASLKALCHLAAHKGYAFVGCNRNGANAFFVRQDRKPDTLEALTAEEGFVAGAFGEMFAGENGLIKMTPAEEAAYLERLGLPLVTIDDPG